jgi:hypothetical protein
LTSDKKSIHIIPSPIQTKQPEETIFGPFLGGGWAELGWDLITKSLGCKPFNVNRGLINPNGCFIGVHFFCIKLLFGEYPPN